MIEKTFKSFDTSSDEGKLLLSAIAILTSISHKDIDERKFGGTVSPDSALSGVQDLANKIYYEEEWKSAQIKENRNKKILKIENE
jgi:hypothetical protein